jgi:hypothetical protein
MFLWLLTKANSERKDSCQPHFFSHFAPNLDTVTGGALEIVIHELLIANVSYLPWINTRITAEHVLLELDRYFARYLEL